MVMARIQGKNSSNFETAQIEEVNPLMRAQKDEFSTAKVFHRMPLHKNEGAVQ